MDPKVFTRIALVSIVVLLYSDFVDANKLRLCVVSSKYTSRRIQKNCPKLTVPDSRIECVMGDDRFNCLRRIAMGSSDFTVLQPEDLVAAASNSEFNVLVTNELRFFPNEKSQYEVIALMQNDVNIEGSSDLMGRRFCHPGYESTSDWTPALATYFENTVVQKECAPDKTLVENRVAASSKFFEAACMAGAWTTDAKLDSKLKSKYKNLCALCDNPSGCYSGDKYHGREGALLCLTDGMGDIAWVRQADAVSHFETLGINKTDFSYFCPDGSRKPMQSSEPCIWISKPWPVIVARSNASETVAKLMASLDTERIPWHGAFVRLMENYHLSAMNTDYLQTPDDYMQTVPGFLSANSRATCQPSRTIQWCVSSNVEERKCRSLREAAFVNGVEPAISCYQQPNRMACLDAVRNRRADLFVTTSEEEVVAKSKGLKRVLHVFTNDRDDLNKVAAVVKTSSGIRTLQQLRGTKACFTGYRSTGWNAFVSKMRNVSGSSWECSDAKAVSNFFKESCVLGLDEKNDTLPHNLYSLCEEGGQSGDEASTFKCLASGKADVAFISLNTIKQNTGPNAQRTWALGLNDEDYRPLCFNDSNPDTCYLAWTTLGSVMVHQNVSEVRFEEIYSALLQMDQLFGQTFNGQTPAFSMYGIYDGNRSIIFPEQTQHLQGDVSHVRLERSYAEIVNDLIKNPPCNNARHLYSCFTQTAILCLTTVLLSQLLRP